MGRYSCTGFPTSQNFPSEGSASSITTAEALAMREEGLLMKSFGHFYKPSLANDWPVNCKTNL